MSRRRGRPAKRLRSKAGRGGRLLLVAAALSLPVVAPGRALAQPGTGGEGTVQDVLDVFGLSCGLLVAMTLAALAWHVVSIFIAGQLAGLDTTVGRALATPLVTIVIAIPFVGLLALLSSSMSNTAQAIAGQVASGSASLLAIKWIFKAPWDRSLLAFLLASILTALGVLLLMIVGL